MDVEKLEQNHNALQIMFNLLLHSLAAKAPGVIDDWLNETNNVLETTPQIRGIQRETMKRVVKALEGVRRSDGAIN